MDNSHPKNIGSPDDRVVAFPGANIAHESRAHGVSRPKGVEMNRSMTQEDRELAAAGYEHLEAEKIKPGNSAIGLTSVDIQEHRLPITNLEEVLKTSIDTKEAGQSFGLTSEEAKFRLQRDGHNILTPPKKKSAFRKVRKANVSARCIVS